MPVVMLMKWNGVTKEQYETVRRTVRWETNVPKGAGFHVSAFDGDGLRVVDVWESEGAFNAFMKDRLQAGIQKAGIKGEPHVEFYPAHAVFNPGTPAGKTF